MNTNDKDCQSPKTLKIVRKVESAKKLQTSTCKISSKYLKTLVKLEVVQVFYALVGWL